MLRRAALLALPLALITTLSVANSFPNHHQTSTITTAEATALRLWPSNGVQRASRSEIITEQHFYATSTTTSTTTSQPARPPVPKPRKLATVHRVEAATPVAPADGCMANRRKSVGEAHACWDGLLRHYDWDYNRAFRILMCESGGNPWAANPSGARGLMQILSKDKQGRPIGSFDPTLNMQQAWAKYSGAGYSWSPWVCR